MHTHDVKKYALNLGIFALVSEIPFDLAFAGKPFYLDYQNVFFTLFIGLVMMIFLQKIDSKAQKDAGAWQRANWKVSVGKLLVIVAACAVATLLKTDYSAMGILTIVLMYNMRKNKMYCIGIGCAVLTLLSLNEITCFLAMIPVHFYNGKRGLNLEVSVLCVLSGASAGAGCGDESDLVTERPLSRNKFRGGGLLVSENGKSPVISKNHRAFSWRSRRDLNPRAVV